MTFMQFWKTVNDILASKGQPELPYGEARAWFNGASFRGERNRAYDCLGRA